MRLLLNHLTRYWLYCGLLLIPNAPLYAIDAAKEDEIKAVYLLNLGSFVHWPPASLNEYFQVCVVGDDPLGDTLDFLVQEIKTVRNRTLQVQHFSADSSLPLTQCHIMFISDSEQFRLTNLLQTLQNQPILTVSDSERFVIRGGMVQFYRLGSKIRLMLDPNTIVNAGLKPSANLMRIASVTEQ